MYSLVTSFSFPILGQCVGLYNLRYFTLFLMEMLVGTCYCSLMTLPVIVRLFTSGIIIIKQFFGIIRVVIATKTLFQLILVLCHIYSTKDFQLRNLLNLMGTGVLCSLSRILCCLYLSSMWYALGYWTVLHRWCQPGGRSFPHRVRNRVFFDVRQFYCNVWYHICP